MLEVDYEYLRLYEFSASLGACLKQDRGVTNASSKFGIGKNPGSGLSGRNDWEFPPTSPAYYLEQAINASERLLRLISTFRSLTKEGTLRYAGSRYYMKIVFAAVFLIQVNNHYS
jgi:hypothetical protein